MIVFRTEGRGPRVQGAHAKWLALALERKGLTMLVEDQSGRTLAELGSGVRSPVGRVVLGSSRVRPRIGAFVRSRLSRRARAVSHHSPT